MGTRTQLWLHMGLLNLLHLEIMWTIKLPEVAGVRNHPDVFEGYKKFSDFILLYMLVLKSLLYSKKIIVPSNSLDISENLSIIVRNLAKILHLPSLYLKNKFKLRFS